MNLRIFSISILVIFIGKRFVVDGFLTNYHNLDNFTDHDVQTELNILFSITETSKWGQKMSQENVFWVDWVKEVFFFCFFCKLSPAGIWNESTFNVLYITVRFPFFTFHFWKLHLYLASIEINCYFCGQLDKHTSHSQFTKSVIHQYQATV